MGYNWGLGLGVDVRVRVRARIRVTVGVRVRDGIRVWLTRAGRPKSMHNQIPHFPN